MQVDKEFVLDTSVTMAWYFSEEFIGYAKSVYESFEHSRAVVPSLWPLEVSNSVLSGERRKRSTETKAATWLAILESLPIEIDSDTHLYAWKQSLHLARSQNLSVYDASYLELAMRRGLPLATLDEKLRTAAKAVGVPLLENTGFKAFLTEGPSLEDVDLTRR